MNILSILFKLLPAVKDAFFGKSMAISYVRKNRAITMLFLALVITLLSFFYMYEQAFMHGVLSKVKSEYIAELEAIIDKAKKDVKKVNGNG